MRRLSCESWFLFVDFPSLGIVVLAMIDLDVGAILNVGLFQIDHIVVIHRRVDVIEILGALFKIPSLIGFAIETV